jgi:hypothetical protein
MIATNVAKDVMKTPVACKDLIKAGNEAFMKIGLLKTFDKYLTFNDAVSNMWKLPFDRRQQFLGKALGMLGIGETKEAKEIVGSLMRVNNEHLFTVLSLAVMNALSESGPEAAARVCGKLDHSMTKIGQLLNSAKSEETKKKLAEYVGLIEPRALTLESILRLTIAVDNAGTDEAKEEIVMNAQWVSCASKIDNAVILLCDAVRFAHGDAAKIEIANGLAGILMRTDSPHAFGAACAAITRVGEISGTGQEKDKAMLKELDWLARLATCNLSADEVINAAVQIPRL